MTPMTGKNFYRFFRATVSDSQMTLLVGLLGSCISHHFQVAISRSATDASLVQPCYIELKYLGKENHCNAKTVPFYPIMQCNGSHEAT